MTVKKFNVEKAILKHLGKIEYPGDGLPRCSVCGRFFGSYGDCWYTKVGFDENKEFKVFDVECLGCYFSKNFTNDGSLIKKKGNWIYCELE